MSIPVSARNLQEVFGFVNAGGRPRWGRDVGEIQELPTGDETSFLMWWLVGRQDFLQFELFQYSSPPQHLREEDWRASDIGWVRTGVTVPDFDRCLRALAERGLSTLTEPVGPRGSRRVCFEEPASRSIFEIIEDDGTLPAGRSHAESPLPAVAYVALSVSDIDDARRYFSGALGLEEIPPETLHHAEHERLWGLPGARRVQALFRAGDSLLEVVQYLDPAPRPPREGALLNDQGILNAAIGYRDRSSMLTALESLIAEGATTNMGPPGETGGGCYLRIADGISLELLHVPADLDLDFGFTAIAQKMPVFAPLESRA